MNQPARGAGVKASTTDFIFMGHSPISPMANVLESRRQRGRLHNGSKQTPPQPNQPADWLVMRRAFVGIQRSFAGIYSFAHS